MSIIKTVVGLLSLAAALPAAVVTFSGVNPVTYEQVTLDSVRVENLSTGRDTTLVGVTVFNVDTWTDVFSPDGVPSRFALLPNYPNGFEKRTVITVLHPEEGWLTFRLYNVLGQQIMAGQQAVLPGGNRFQLDAEPLPRGVYFLSVESGKARQTIKMLKTGPAMGGAITLSRIGGGEAVVPLRKAAAGQYRFTAFAKGYVSTTVERTIIGDTFIQFSMLPPQPPADFTSNWHGFNLLGFFTVENSKTGFLESDFQMISEFGFNFVRLPIDYHAYTKSNDWTAFIEAKLQQIDRAVEWGQKYGIHVCINLHQAPGFSYNPPNDPSLSLWTSPLAQQAFAAHWRMFAERYRNVPREALSFNLVNEPSNVSAADYVKAVAPAIEAIRAVSPDRIIISDAINWGNSRVDPILVYNVVMSPHFYLPMQITHYKAEWVSGADSWPEPKWPPMLVCNIFYGYLKSPWNTPLVIKGAFPAGTVVTIHVRQVSYKADFRAYLGKEQIYQKVFQPGPGAGEWKEVIYQPEWNIYQNIYDREYSFTLPKSSEEISFRVLDGDWMTWTELRFEPPAGSDMAEAVIQPGMMDWGVPQATFRLEKDGSLLLVSAPKGFEDRYKLNGFLQQWVDLKNSGVPVHVGEWGVYNKTPHDVTLAFMENRLLAMKWAGLGWALWEFRGSFGILNSGRKDVKYENYKGYKLDRKMLELLQRYK